VVILALLMMLQLLNIQELQSILIGFLKGKNLHGQTLHTPLMHAQFPSTAALHPENAAFDRTVSYL
jgi:hypothetical protein